MKLKLEKIVNATQPLSRLMVQPMKIAQSWSLSKLSKLIDVELKSFDEARNKLLAEYGTLTEDGTQYIFATDKAMPFSEEIKSLLDQEIDIEIVPISLSKLDRIDISASDLLMLDWLIVE